MPTLSLGRTYYFEAAHRLASDQLDQSENERIFGKCARLGGHGHNYEITLRLRSDARRPLSRAELDRRVKAELLDRVDHRNLDQVLPGRVTTGETLARVFFEWLEPQLRDVARLLSVSVRETRSNHFEYAPAEGA